VSAARAKGPILLVEADAERAEGLARQLMADGFGVELARNAEHARILAGLSAPKLALLCDIGLPRGTLQLLEEIRRPGWNGAAWDRRMPAIVMAAGAGELERLRAFESGADDVVANSVGYLELRARVNALLRRTGPAVQPTEHIDVGFLAIDLLTRTARLSGRAISLRPLEFDLLVHLAREPVRVFATSELLRSVWGYRSRGSTRTVDSHASRLRRKLGGHWVINVRGVGYKLI
jgi:DNA-binding response OmpR family regulator